LLRLVVDWNIGCCIHSQIPRIQTRQPLAETCALPYENQIGGTLGGPQPLPRLSEVDQGSLSFNFSLKETEGNGRLLSNCDDD
jgi:hypothetical protein